jgi:hypothetical protein
MHLLIIKLGILFAFVILVNKLSFFVDNEKVSMVLKVTGLYFTEKEGSCFGESICNDFIGEV